MRAILLAMATIMASVVVHQDAGQYTRDGISYETPEACVAAATDGLGGQPRECVQVNRIEIAGSCADVPEPADFVPEQLQELCPGSDTRWQFADTYQARADDSKYPACWEVRSKQTNDCTTPYDLGKPVKGFVPKLSPPAVWIEAPYPGPLANPQTPAAP